MMMPPILKFANLLKAKYMRIKHHYFFRLKTSFITHFEREIENTIDFSGGNL